MANWPALIEKNLGLTASLGQAVASAKSCEPDIRGPSLVVTSDYGGSHRGSGYDVYSVLVGDLVLCSGWRTAWGSVRPQLLADNRRMSYKGLNDGQRRRALGPFLAAANRIPGICASLAVSKGAGTLFEPRSGAINPELSECLSWDKALFERTLRIVHIVSFIVAGVSNAGQDVLWFTDEDEIAETPDRLGLLTKLWGNVMSNYAVHGFGHLRCGTTGCDSGSNEIEDLAAIPDLVAGALADLLTPIAGQLKTGIVTPLPLRAKAKASAIGQWLLQENHMLKRIILVIDKEPGSPKLKVARLRFHDLSPAQLVTLSA